MPYIPIRAPADLQRLAVNATREDHWIEFKREPQTRSEEASRDVAQFANASGGVLVIGADEVAHVLSGWRTVSTPDDYIRWLDDAVKGNLMPVPVTEPHVLQVPSGEIVVALNIPPSLALIARRQGEGFEFPIRAGDSRRYMTLMEIEARMGNKERAMRLRIEKISQDAPVGLDARVQGAETRGWRVAALDDDAVTLSRGGIRAVVPLAYVEAVQRANEEDAEWMIGLSCAIQAVPLGPQPTRFLVRKFNL